MRKKERWVRDAEFTISFDESDEEWRENTTREERVDGDVEATWLSG